MTEMNSKNENSPICFMAPFADVVFWATLYLGCGEHRNLIALVTTSFLLSFQFFFLNLSYLY